MTHGMIRTLMALTLVTVVSAPAAAQRMGSGLSPAYRTNGRQVTRVFDEPATPARRATVTVVAEGKPVALGTIVDARGYIVTKASEVEGPLGVTTFDDRSFRAKRVAVDEENDLALLRIVDQNLAPVAWSDADASSLGLVVATVWPNHDDVRIGVIGAVSRPIKRLGGVLGIGLGGDDDAFGGVEVQQVYPKSGASEAGLKPRDIVVSVDGQPTPKRDKLIELVTSHDPGDVLKVAVRRGQENLEFNITLGHRTAIFDLFNRNLQMSGKTSKRRAGFSQVLQHDITLDPDDVGGPLVDLDGRVVGLNIARVDRVTTYALPADVVKASVAKMIAAAEASKPPTDEEAGEPAAATP